MSCFSSEKREAKEFLHWVKQNSYDVKYCKLSGEFIEKIPEKSLLAIAEANDWNKEDIEYKLDSICLQNTSPIWIDLSGKELSNLEFSRPQSFFIYALHALHLLSEPNTKELLSEQAKFNLYLHFLDETKLNSLNKKLRLLLCCGSLFTKKRICLASFSLESFEEEINKLYIQLFSLRERIEPNISFDEILCVSRRYAAQVPFRDATFYIHVGDSFPSVKNSISQEIISSEITKICKVLSEKLHKSEDLEKAVLRKLKNLKL